MSNMNTTSNFIFGATEHELITLSLAEIIDGLMTDYKSFSRGNEPGVEVPKEKQEIRMAHSCILYAEGLRLAYTHLELAKKLILASLFANNERAAQWLTLNGEVKQVKELMKRIADFEASKAAKRTDE